LSNNSKAKSEGSPEKSLSVALLQAHDRDECAEGNKQQKERQKSVTKLNNSVDALLRHINKRSWFTFRPGRATKTRASEPNSSAGYDNKNLTAK
jgi:hypothetical protein